MTPPRNDGLDGLCRPRRITLECSIIPVHVMPSAIGAGVVLVVILALIAVAGIVSP